MSQTKSVNRISDFLSRPEYQPCLIPYITAGDPNLAVTQALLQRLDQAGAPIIEVGIPYSDSIADGPVIQASFHRALERGIRIDALLSAIRETRQAIRAALVAMVSVSLVRKMGFDPFAAAARDAGFDGWIVPDVPIEEADALHDAGQSNGLCTIMMAAPTTPTDRRREIARRATGFVYLVGARGITGERSDLAAGLADSVAEMKRASALPVMVGFGISTPQQVRQVCRVADGAIVGSAIVRRACDAIDGGAGDDAIVEGVGRFVDQLGQAVCQVVTERKNQ